MKTETYTAPGLTFEYTETEPDGGGQLAITATTEAAKEELCEMYRKSLPAKERFAPLMAPDPYTVTFPARDSQNGRVAQYAFPVALDDAWFKPYKDLLRKITGYEGDALELAIEQARPLCHTHHMTDLRVEDGHLQATIFVDSHDWNRKTALDYGHQKAETYFKRDVGESPLTPEYIHASNGRIVHNPEYGRGPKPPEPRIAQYPGAIAQAVWKALWLWWVENHANAKQREVLTAADALDSREKRSAFYRPWWTLENRGSPEYYIRYLDPAGTCNYDGKGTMTSGLKWEEFAALK